MIIFGFGPTVLSGVCLANKHQTRRSCHRLGLPLLVSVISLNDLTDQNHLLLEFSSMSIIISPPSSNHRINWKKYLKMMQENFFPDLLTFKISDIGNLIEHFSKLIFSAIEVYHSV